MWWRWSEGHNSHIYVKRFQNIWIGLGEYNTSLKKIFQKNWSVFGRIRGGQSTIWVNICLGVNQTNHPRLTLESMMSQYIVFRGNWVQYLRLLIDSGVQTTCIHCIPWLIISKTQEAVQLFDECSYSRVQATYHGWWRAKGAPELFSKKLTLSKIWHLTFSSSTDAET